MRWFIMLALIVLPLVIFSQDVVNQLDKDAKKHGRWIKKDSTGQKIYEGNFEHGVPSGEFRYYYKDGKLKMISQLSSGGKVAATVSFFPNGKKMAEGLYRNEKKDSTWTFYSETGDFRTKEETYRNGILHGPSRLYYPEGGIVELKFYQDGILEGNWEKYDEQGNVRLKGNYKAGDKNGSLTVYGPKGQVLTRGKYTEGHLDGEWTYYTEEGKIKKKDTYKMGRLVKSTDAPEKASPVQK